MAARTGSRSPANDRSRARGWKGRCAAVLTMSTLALHGLGVASADQTDTAKPEQESDTSMKIQLTIDGREVIAILDDNATAMDFLALLPLTLTLSDFNRTEKVSDLPRRLSTEGAPDGIDPTVGDITYYAPWGNLALFYRDFGYATGLVRLGRIDAGIDVLSKPGPLTVSIERVE